MLRYSLEAVRIGIGMNSRVWKQFCMRLHCIAIEALIKSRKYAPRLTDVVLFQCEASLIITGPVDVVPESADVGSIS